MSVRTFGALVLGAVMGGAVGLALLELDRPDPRQDAARARVLAERAAQELGTPSSTAAEESRKFEAWTLARERWLDLEARARYSGVSRP